MLERLEAVEQRFHELTALLSQPDAAVDRANFRKVAKEHAELEPIVEGFRHWRKVARELDESKEMLETESDAEVRALAQEEVSCLKEEKERLYQALVILLLPKDPSDDKNIILEIHAGTGGDEAALFAAVLFNMFSRYSDGRGWRVEIMNTSESSVGGFKELIARIEGRGAFSAFKYERGVHRVQRVPTTETQGRIHTSTVKVAVLPEAEEVDVEILDKDLRIDVFRASGPGGQSVNTTDSAVRVTHVPSGLVVSCQDEKSQLKNKNKALAVLRARLFDLRQAELDAERGADRRAQIGTGERSERIRTYNYPQGRITDHRIGLTLYQLDTVLAGELGLLIEPLTTHYRMLALQNSDQSST